MTCNVEKVTWLELLGAANARVFFPDVARQSDVYVGPRYPGGVAGNYVL